MLALMLLTAVQQQTLDTTVAVRPETRLEVHATAGSIDVKVWDRSAVQIVARPERGSIVRVETMGAVLRVSSRTPTGRIDLVSYEITVPRRMDLTLGRGDVDISVRGSDGALALAITAGKITVDSAGGSVNARSLQGPITVQHSRAKVLAHSDNAPVTLTGVTGEIDAESTGSHVTLTNVDSRSVRASSVGGVIQFSGPLHEDGKYDLMTHDGAVFIKTGTPVNATVNVASVGGGFNSPIPHEITDRRRQGIFTARFGNGRAQVSAESFGGAIHLDGYSGSAR